MLILFDIFKSFGLKHTQKISKVEVDENDLQKSFLSEFYNINVDPYLSDELGCKFAIFIVIIDKNRSKKNGDITIES